MSDMTLFAGASNAFSGRAADGSTQSAPWDEGRRNRGRLRLLAFMAVFFLSAGTFAADDPPDSEQLTRFGIDAAALPAGTTIINRPESFLDKYWRLTAGALIVTLSLFIAAVVLGVNIRLRRRAEKTLRESEERFRLLFEYAPSSYQSLDSEGRFIVVNQAWLKMLGYTRDEVVGNWFGDFLTEDDRALFRQRFSMFKERGEVSGVEFHMVRKDGSVLLASVEGRIGYTSRGEFKQTHCVLHDITARRRADEALRQSEELYRTLFETMTQGVVYQDANGRVTSVNPAAERILGLSLEQMQGRTSSDPRWRTIHEDGSEFPGETHPAMIALRTGQPVQDVIMGIYHPVRDDHVWTRVSAAPQFRPGEDKPYQVYATLEDITERKQAEEEIAKLARFPGENPNPVLRIAGDGEILYANAPGAALLKARMTQTGKPTAEYLRDRAPGLMTAGRLVTEEIEAGDRIYQFTYAPVAESGYINLYCSDITERKQAEESLRKSEEQHRAILQTAIDGFWMADMQGRLLAVNTAYCRMSGYSESELLAMRIADLEAVETSADIGAHIRSLMARGEERFESRHRRKDGSIYEVEVSAKHQPEEGGRFVCFLRDITKRKRAEEELTSTTAFLDTVVDMSPFAMWVADPDGTIIRTNRSLREVLKLTDEQLIGKYNVLKDANLEKQGLISKAKAVFEKHESVRFSMPWKAAEAGDVDFEDGQDLYIDVSMFPILNAAGDLLHVVCQWVDITERKQAEEALLSEKLLSENYINSLPGLFYVFDETRFIRWNKAWEEVTGYGADELAAKYGDDFFEGDDRKLIKEHMLKVFREGRTEVEAELTTKDGRRIPYFFTGLRREFNGKPHLVGLGIDVTERQRAAAKRRELEAQLRQSQKMEAVGQLAGGVAHDFNNILTTILGNVELSMDSVRSEFGAKHDVVQSMEQIEKAAQRASALTRQLLTFSRRDVMRPQALSLNRILADLDKMLRRLITEDVKLEMVADPELKTVRADAGQLEQVVVNLVINAVHAMPNGGRLTLETQNVTLDEDYACGHVEARRGPHVLLTVSDTGCGMDAETQARIFEPFFTTKPVDQGTGLGLATVHGIVKQSGGHIMVYSEPGHGTTFRIYLPAYDASPDEETPIPRTDASARAYETVLLCEDDGPVRELIALSLRSAGYTVITAGGGHAGLEAGRNHVGDIDLLITDVIMPDMNGRALCERLHETRPGLPSLFISGYTSNVIAHHGVLDEGVEFLEKPFTRQDLLTRVRAVINKTRSDV